MRTRMIFMIVLAFFMLISLAFSDVTDRLYNLEDASGMFNERGYLKSNSFSYDGNEIINDFNGNLIYTQQLAYYPGFQNGVHLDLKITYNGNVGHFTLGGQDYGTSLCRTNINLPEWIISLNGIAIQTFNFENEIITWQSIAGSDTSYNNDVAALINGYHSCYSENPIEGYGIISILMGDGSINEYYCHSYATDGPFYMRSGAYLSKSKNDRNRGYLWSSSDSLYGYFTLFQEDGTQILFEIIKPEFKTCIEGQFPPSIRDEPKILLPKTFKDNMGHEFECRYHENVTVESNIYPIYGHPIISVIDHNNEFGSNVCFNWNYHINSELVIDELSIDHGSIHYISFSSISPQLTYSHSAVQLNRGKNRATVDTINYTNSIDVSRKTSFEYRSCDRFYDSLTFNKYSFDYCNDSGEAYVGNIYHLNPIRLYKIKYPDGGSSYFSYYNDEATSWPSGSLLIDDELTVEPHDFMNSCIFQSPPKIPCLKSPEFNNLGRDPFFTNMVTAARRLSTDGEVISLDSLEFSWTDHDLDEMVSELDSFWTVRYYSKDHNLMGSDQVKKREVLYHYYPEGGPFSHSARDRGWTIKMDYSKETKLGSSNWVTTKRYSWDIGECENNVCDGTFELIELETEIKNGINVESFSEYYNKKWDGDSANIDNNNILWRDKIDPWGVLTRTKYDDSYFEANSPDDYYTNSLVSCAYQEDTLEGTIFNKTTTTYYDGTTDNGFAGQPYRKYDHLRYGYDDLSRVTTYYYLKDDAPYVRDSGALKKVVDYMGNITLYSYQTIADSVYYRKWCYDGSTIENYPRFLSSQLYQYSGPYWFRKQILLAVGSPEEVMEIYRDVDKKGRLVWLMDPNGYSSDIKYDGLDRVTQIILPGCYGPCYDQRDPIEPNEPEPDFPHNEYDPYPIIYTYDDEYTSNPVSVESKLQVGEDEFIQRKKTWFDGLSRAIQSDMGITPDSCTSTYSLYDYSDRMVKNTDQLGYSDSISYDHLDREIKTIYPDPNSSEININYFITNKDNPDLGLDQFSFPEGAKIIFGKEYIDENGHSVEEYSDVRSKLRLRRTYVDSARTQELNTYFDYDAFGQLILVIKPMGDSVFYKYDALGQLIQEFSYDRGRITYKYDKNGNLYAMQDDKLWQMVTGGYRYWQSFRYDALNRLIEIRFNTFQVDTLPCHPEKVQDSCDLIYLSYPANIVKQKQFWYDQDLSENSKGRLSAALSIDTSEVYSYGERYNYDPRGRITSQINYFQARTEEIQMDDHTETNIVGDSIFIAYDYNMADQISGIKYPDGMYVIYTYDQAGRLTDVGLDGNEDYFAHITYTSRNEILSMTLGEGLQTIDYEYNERGWLTEINDGASQSTFSGDLFGERLYYYDYPLGGGVTHQYNGNIGNQLISITGFNERFDFLYDASDRIWGVAAENDTSYLHGHQSFQYDANGNRLESAENRSGWRTTEYLYDFPDIPNRLTGITNADTNSYQYDANGNLEVDSAKQARLHYDIFNRLEEIKFAQPLSNDSNRLWFGYNTDDLRVIKTYSLWSEVCADSTDPGGDDDEEEIRTLGGPPTEPLPITSSTVRTYYIRAKPLGGKVLAEQPCGAACGPVFKFIYAGDQRIAMYDKNGDLFFFLNDHLGSPRVVVKSDGTVKDKHWYEAFGESRAIQDSTGQHYRYTGKPFDEDNEIDIYYYGARYYDPEPGRFLSVDPLASKYPGLSPYIYCNNNPVKYTDPNGQFFVVDDVITGPVDELVVLGILAVGAAIGIEPAQEALDWAVDKITDVFHKDDTKDEDKPIEIAPEDMIPDDELNPPTKRGNAPTDKKTGKSIEIHHKNQSPNGPCQEIREEDHRGPGKMKENHPNRISQIDRKKANRDRRRHWIDRFFKKNNNNEK